jgi:hypothetical protein
VLDQRRVGDELGRRSAEDHRPHGAALAHADASGQPRERDQPRHTGEQRHGAQDRFRAAEHGDHELFEGKKSGRRRLVPVERPEQTGERDMENVQGDERLDVPERGVGRVLPQTADDAEDHRAGEQLAFGQHSVDARGALAAIRTPRTSSMQTVCRP